MIWSHALMWVMSEKYPYLAESYRGLSIWYDPISGKYYANLCEHMKRDMDIKKVKAWIRKMKM
ncbi:hypothetical protein HN807_10745 [Candidatus Bathyarchaeota archaeon]|jgi:hypothetical protein|nr:hypothetical protein [Candidatus Bathyarchaeota archaeon]MBT4321368.1 hypothetical protein [Candidatus Bathyarchaeota archaeon]MBT4422825.1 hypothetical protein [Candidatus Bathyarchaeota archaeon]MBT7186081.1 hypothetical protein [Candidatus Bathyarchaeota archaeon]MBT7347548.1 hypothetical protein [Candidatus Bathyarchaeota archaeon]